MEDLNEVSRTVEASSRKRAIRGAKKRGNAGQEAAERQNLFAKQGTPLYYTRTHKPLPSLHLQRSLDQLHCGHGSGDRGRGSVSGDGDEGLLAVESRLLIGDE
jgi:hypothetical protein